jgi:hypothetical protein
MEILLNGQARMSRLKNCSKGLFEASHCNETMLDSFTYSQIANGAQQKRNIFCLIFAKRKSLIFISSFFAPSRGNGWKPA